MHALRSVSSHARICSVWKLSCGRQIREPYEYESRCNKNDGVPGNTAARCTTLGAGQGRQAAVALTDTPAPVPGRACSGIKFFAGIEEDRRKAGGRRRHRVASPGRAGRAMDRRLASPLLVVGVPGGTRTRQREGARQRSGQGPGRPAGTTPHRRRAASPAACGSAGSTTSHKS